ncbi:MAG: DUF1501 domain-containing protein [Acidobacteriota bacterium]
MCHDPRKGCRDYQTTRRGLSRRGFLGSSAGLLSALAVPSWLPKVALAAEGPGDRDVLVSIFLRGGADGLTLCVPHAEDNYYRLRPTLAIPRPDASSPDRALDLDGRFGLPPAMTPLLEAFRGGDLAIVHACGMAASNRSHFDSMHFMEVGQGNPPASLFTGWLARHLATTAPATEGAVLRGLGLGFGLPRTLVGAPQTLPIEDPAGFDFLGDPGSLADRRAALETMYRDLDNPLGKSAGHTFDTIELLKRIDFAGYQPAGGASYPEDEFGEALRSTAALIRAQVGVEAITIDLGGWDTHEVQGSLDGQLALLMSSFARGLAAFHQDLEGASVSNVSTVAMSEFGRNVFENGSAGTDHGYGGILFALGPNVQGGRVVTDWPGLDDDQLFENQDVRITADVRDVLSEALTKRLGNADVRNVFADPTFTPRDWGIFT